MQKWCQLSVRAILGMLCGPLRWPCVLGSGFILEGIGSCER